MVKLIDKALNIIGLRRVNNATETGSGGLTASSLWDWIMAPFSGWQTIDVELRYRLPMLRREARRMAANNPIIRQYLELLRDNVIGPQGIRLQAQVRNNNGGLNKAFNDKIEAAWTEFWKSPWADGRMSGIAGEQLLVKSMATEGEIFVRLVVSPRFRFGVALQMLDPDLFDSNHNAPRTATSNEIRLGVEVDDFNRPVAYWSYQHNPNDLGGGNRDRVRIPAEEIIHIFDPERIGQTRGFTWFNTVMQNLKNLDGYVEAAIVAARTAACAVPIFKQTGDFDQTEDQSAFNVDLSPGSGFTLPQGLELQNWDPKHPNTNHAEFIKGNLRFTSSGLHVSYNALANDLEGVNYSSMRSGLLIERDGWKVLQQMWIDRFRQPVYEWFLWGALMSGQLTLDSRDPRKFQGVKWIPRGWQWVDPLKDVTASIIAIENGLSSRTKILSEQGADFEDICDELATEQQSAKDSGLDFSGASATNNAQTQAETEEQPPATPTRKAALRLAVLNMLQAED